MCCLDILSIKLYIYNNFANLKSVSSEIRRKIPTTFRRKSKNPSDFCRNISMEFQRTLNPYRNSKIIIFCRNFVGYFRRLYFRRYVVGMSSKKTDENIVRRNVRQNVACFLVVNIRTELMSLVLWCLVITQTEPKYKLRSEDI